MQAETFGLQSGYTYTGQPDSIQVKKERLFFPNQWGSGSLEGLGQQFMEDGKKAGFTGAGAEAKGDGAKDVISQGKNGYAREQGKPRQPRGLFPLPLLFPFSCQYLSDEEASLN